MKRPRLRNWSRWICTAVCVLLAITCGFFSFWELRWKSGNNSWINIGYCAVGAGSIDRVQYELRFPGAQWTDEPRGFTFKFTGFFTEQLWLAYRNTPYVKSGSFPLWLPLLLATIPTALLWRLELRARRRSRLNLCPLCAYDRRGLASDTKCPECGVALPK